ncbi:MAG: glycosyltransferase [Deltaproteobacteria bacterium]|nr:glycosyltransferase [Deltaproteobacteria bacterium]
MIDNLGDKKSKIRGTSTGQSTQHAGVRSETSVDEKLDRILESDFFRHKMNELRLLRLYKDRPQDIKVSVIMPTWNRAFIIGRAIHSVLRQAYHNFELIISDDGSIDNSTQYIKENYPDNRIMYIKSNHSGVSAARNIALRQSSGSLIGYLDSDDEWSENYLLLMVNAFADNPGAGTVYCGVKSINYVCNHTSVFFKAYDRKALLRRNYIPINGFMHKRELYRELGGFNQDLTVLEDWDLILRYTKTYPPLAVECTLATYFFEKDFDHLTLSKDLYDMNAEVKKLHITE